MNEKPGLIKALKFRLEAWGYQVLVAHTHQQARRTLSRKRPDLIISGEETRTAEGRAFLQMIQNNPSWRDIPFVFLCIREGNDETLIHDEAVRILKPFDVQTLKATIDTALASRKGQSCG